MVFGIIYNEVEGRRLNKKYLSVQGTFSEVYLLRKENDTQSNLKS